MALNVVVTGGSRGIGLALAQEFHRLGDNVVLTSRTEAAGKQAADKIRESNAALGGSNVVVSAVCDVTVSASMEQLAVDACARLPGGKVDVWINNAGMDQDEPLPLFETPAEVIEQVARTNGFSALFGMRAALRLFVKQGHGHVFTMDGAGSNGMSTPKYATYGWTKAGFPQMLKSVSTEMASYPDIGVHLVSPGLVITDLLLKHAESRKTLQVFNILAEYPETVAKWMVPRVRAATHQNSKGQYIQFLTTAGAAWRFMTAFMSTNRLFDVDEMFQKLSTDREGAKTGYVKHEEHTPELASVK